MRDEVLCFNKRVGGQIEEKVESCSEGQFSGIRLESAQADAQQVARSMES